MRWAKQVLFFQLYKWGNRMSFLSLQRLWLKLRFTDTHPNVFSFKWINKKCFAFAQHTKVQKYLYIYGVNKVDGEWTRECAK